MLFVDSNKDEYDNLNGCKIFVFLLFVVFIVLFKDRCVS